jgi:hypothetical protein
MPKGTFSIDKVRAAFLVTLRSLGSGQTGIDRTIKSQVRAAATPKNIRSGKRRFLPGVPPFDGIGRESLQPRDLTVRERYVQACSVQKGEKSLVFWVFFSHKVDSRFRLVLSRSLDA